MPPDNERPQPKFGAGHFQAMGRLGVNELRNAVFCESNVAQRYPESGLYGTVTQSEVGQQRQADLQPQPDAQPEPPSRDELDMDRE